MADYMVLLYSVLVRDGLGMAGDPPGMGGGWADGPGDGLGDGLVPGLGAVLGAVLGDVLVPAAHIFFLETIATKTVEKSEFSPVVRLISRH